MTKLMTSLMVLALSSLFSVANANTNDVKIAERIAPVGSVCIEGTECAAAGKAVAVVSGPRSGSDVYGAYCSACHSSDAMGAPKSGDSAAWKSRLAKGFDKTLSNALNGLNAMPAKGMCSDCSKAEISNAIKHMSK